MSDAEIVDEALGMVIGGHETSASALTWIWYELDRHPDIRERMIEEVDRVVGEEPLRIEHVKELVFTKMVIDETLRLHPPFWFENRNIKESIELGGTDCRLGRSWRLAGIHSTGIRNSGRTRIALIRSGFCLIRKRIRVRPMRSSPLEAVRGFASDCTLPRSSC